MKKLRTQTIGIDEGDVVLFSDFESGGPMWTGDGPREVRAQVAFAEPFVAPPSVRVALTMWDMSNATNARADVAAEDVDKSGFAILFRTWGDTHVARVRVGWQAIGPLRDDDIWEVD